MKRFALITLLLLAACNKGAPEKDYASRAACDGLGYKAGTPEYQKCVEEEYTSRMMEQNRREFEARKADEEYYKSRRALGY